MNSFDRAYLEVLKEIEHKGFTKDDRTGTGTISRFGTQARFSLKDNRIPLLSLRKVFHRSFIHETLWFLSGSTDIEYLKKNNVSIWDSWVKPGTERYRELSKEAINADLNRYYQAEVDLLLGFKEASPLEQDGRLMITVKLPEDSFNSENLLNGNLELDGWKQAYRDMRIKELKAKITASQQEDGWETVSFRWADDWGSDWWAKEAVAGEYHREFYYGGPEALVCLYKTLTGKDFDIEPRVLIGGSIGDGAYGSQWRNWDDTRIVQINNVDEYVNRGFEHMGRLGKTDKAIVRREIDQIANVVQLLKTNPDSRRILLVAYNPSRVEDCVLPACHSFVQWWTRELDNKERAKLLSKEQMEEYGAFVYNTLEGDYGDAKVRELIVKWFDERNVPSRALSCHLYMRSNDVGVGAVFNIPQYGLLTHMLAQVTGMVAEELIWTNGDSHIYLNHADGLSELFSREGHDEEARVKLNPEITGIDDFKFEDIEIVNYKHDDTIKFPVAI